MKKITTSILIISLLMGLLPAKLTHAQNITERLRGRLLLQVQQGGAIWYVDTNDLYRYQVTWQNALPLFEKLSLGITDNDLSKIPIADTNDIGDWTIRNRLKGKLLLQVEQGGAIWYVDKDGYRHSVTWDNLMPLFQSLALGITDNNLSKITIGISNNPLASVAVLSDYKPKEFQQKLKPKTESYPTTCKAGYIKQGNKCITRTKLCEIRFGKNLYGEELGGASQGRTPNDIGSNTICYCKKGYVWQIGFGYCMELDYDDGISVTGNEGRYISGEYTLFNSEFDSDGDGILDQYDKHPNGGDKIITRHYDISPGCKRILWREKYKCEGWIVKVNIPEDLYAYYKDYNNHAFTTNWGNIDSFVVYDDPVIIDIINQLHILEREKGFSALLAAQLLVNEIVYTDDINSGWDEYPKYPIEVIADGEGDCEDTSYLMAALLKAMGFDIALVKFKNHLAIAEVFDKDFIERSLSDGIDFMWEYNQTADYDKHLLYVETTADNTVTGIMPAELVGEDYEIYFIQ